MLINIFECRVLSFIPLTNLSVSLRKHAGTSSWEINFSFILCSFGNMKVMCFSRVKENTCISEEKEGISKYIVVPEMLMPTREFLGQLQSSIVTYSVCYCLPKVKRDIGT